LPVLAGTGISTRAGAEALLGGLLPRFRRVVECASTEAIKQMVGAGLGVAILSSWATRLEEAAGLLRPAHDARFRQQRGFYIVRRADRPMPGIVEAFWRFMVSAFSIPATD
jgi:DNA-binding transcriptional LysR family regulator